jgi:hypothetical protein
MQKYRTTLGKWVTAKYTVTDNGDKSVIDSISAIEQNLARLRLSYPIMDYDVSLKGSTLVVKTQWQWQEEYFDDFTKQDIEYFKSDIDEWYRSQGIFSYCSFELV